MSKKEIRLKKELEKKVLATKKHFHYHDGIDQRLTNVEKKQQTCLQCLENYPENSKRLDRLEKALEKLTKYALKNPNQRHFVLHTLKEGGD